MCNLLKTTISQGNARAIHATNMATEKVCEAVEAHHTQRASACADSYVGSRKGTNRNSKNWKFAPIVRRSRGCSVRAGVYAPFRSALGC